MSPSHGSGGAQEGQLASFGAYFPHFELILCILAVGACHNCLEALGGQ